MSITWLLMSTYVSKIFLSANRVCIDHKNKTAFFLNIVHIYSGINIPIYLLFTVFESIRKDMGEMIAKA